MESEPSRWTLMRDLLAFQFKLALDGLRDLMLFPISIVSALAGLLIAPNDPAKYFKRLLELGRESDVWINLFGATDHYQQSEHASSDAYVKKLEDMLIAEYHRGGVVKNLKDRTDQLINRIHETPKSDDPPDDR